MMVRILKINIGTKDVKQRILQDILPTFWEDFADRVRIEMYILKSHTYVVFFTNDDAFELKSAVPEFVAGVKVNSDELSEDEVKKTIKYRPMFKDLYAEN